MVSNAATPRPVRLMVLSQRAGMILSVSTLISGRGAATPVRVVKGCMVGLSSRAAGRAGRPWSAAGDLYAKRRRATIAGKGVGAARRRG
jgi:hypothetical protein